MGFTKNMGLAFVPLVHLDLQRELYPCSMSNMFCLPGRLRSITRWLLESYCWAYEALHPLQRERRNHTVAMGRIEPAYD